MRKDIEEFRYRRRILEAILISSTTEANFMFPTEKEFILSELINGTIDYIGREAGKLTYLKYQQSGGNRRFLEKSLFNYFKNEMEAYRMSTNSIVDPIIILNAVTKLVQYHFVNSTGPDRPYPNTELYNHFSMGFDRICHVSCNKSFSLPQEIIVYVKKEILPSLSYSEKVDVIGIGKFMRKFINEDLESIRKNNPL